MNAEEYSHHFSGMVPAEIAEYLKNVFPEFGNLDVEEFLLQQVREFIAITFSWTVQLFCFHLNTHY